MKSFLEEIAERILQHHDVKELKDIAIILPSKRAGLHFKTALSQLVQQTFWAPNLITLDDFIVDLHPLTPVNPIAVHFELYACYKEIVKDPGNFDSFHNWSAQVLNDFNEIDRYLIPTADLFKNLKDIKEIESWSFNNDELSPGQIKFMEFWENLGELYHVFNKQLASKNLSSKGKIYRDIASSPEKYFRETGYKKIYFIGFNALSKSEQIIINFLEKTGKAEVFWDIDQYYIHNTFHEAGNFIRKQTDVKQLGEIPDNLRQAKNISFYPSNSNLEQVNICSQLIDKEFNHSKSAIILADEHLLTPLLNALPEGVKDMNITMGYPVSNTLSFELLQLVFDIQINKKRFSTKQTKDSIYFKDFFSLIDNPLVIAYLQIKKIDLLKLKTELTDSNLSFIKKIDLPSLIFNAPEIAEIIFPRNLNDVTELLGNLVNFFTEIRAELIRTEFERIELEAIYKIISGIKLTEQYNLQFPYIESIEGIKKLFFLIIKNEKLSFYGEPLKGMQIMGLLESRAIDFDNIILLSCNEKFLPGPHIQTSFIPQDLKEYFNLPTKHDRESIFAYYFYRLVHRVKNIHLVYNNGLPNGLDSNEISRYLIQLKHEYPHPINTKYFHFKWSNPKEVTCIPKDVETLSKIDFLFESGLSPSALNTYLRCPLDFYYKYVLRVREKEELEELIENNTQGDIIHKVLEDLYKEQKPVITVSKVDWMLKEYEAYTDREFKKRFPSGSYKYGKNLLYYKMALHSIKLFLQKEQETIKKEGPIEIISLESELRTEIIVQTSMGEKKIVLKGKADRIDRLDGQIRIIDYKSGFTKSEEVISNTLENITKKYKATQLMFYAYLYNKENPSIQALSGIISMKNLNAGLLPFSIKETGNDEQAIYDSYNEFETILSNLIQKIYDPNIPFTHNKEAKYCMMCE